MTTLIVDLVSSVAAPGCVVKDAVIAKIHEAGLFQTVRLAMVDLDDLLELFDGDENACSLANKAWDVAKTRVDGWTKIPSVSTAFVRESKEMDRNHLVQQRLSGPRQSV